METVRSPDARGRAGARGEHGPAGTVTRWRAAGRRMGIGVALGLVVILPLALVVAAPLQDDIAWLLHVARAALAGQSPYTTLIELNPPLIILLSMLPVGAAPVLGLAPGTLYQLLAAAALLALSAITASLLRPLGGTFRRRSQVIVAIAGVLFVLPGPAFGQREHLIAGLLAPWLALATIRLSGHQAPRWVAAAVGGLATLALGLKPHYVLVVLASEALIRRRGMPLKRPEVVALLVTSTLLAAALLAMFPAYLTQVVPLAMRLYGGLDASLPRLLVEARPLLLPLAVLAGLAWGHRGAPYGSPLVSPLLVAVAAGLVIYLVQAKGWAYHRLPAEIALTLLLVGWLASLLDRGRPARRPRLVVGLAIALGLVTGTAVERQAAVLDRTWYAADGPEHWLAALIERTGARSLAGFSERLGPFFPVVDDTGVRWTLRYPSTWALVGQLHDCAACGGQAPDIRAQLVDDVLAGRPDLIVVDAGGRFDPLAVLLGDPRFAALWPDYCPLAKAHGLRAFVRRTAPSGGAEFCRKSGAAPS